MTNAPTPLSLVSGSAIDDDDVDVDGRTRRRNRNRDAVIASLISLMQDGELDPTVAQIADRAGVSHRSIFRYFTDLDDLSRTALETAVRDALPLAVIPRVGEGSLEHRIEGMIASRLRVISYSKMFARVARAKSIALPELHRGLSNVAIMSRDQFRRHFAIELDEMEPRDRAHLTALLSSQMSFEGYDHQSAMLSRTDDEIIDAWRLLLRGLLT